MRKHSFFNLVRRLHGLCNWRYAIYLEAQNLYSRKWKDKNVRKFPHWTYQTRNIGSKRVPKDNNDACRVQMRSVIAKIEKWSISLSISQVHIKSSYYFSYFCRDGDLAATICGNKRLLKINVTEYMEKTPILLIMSYDRTKLNGSNFKVKLSSSI